MPVKKIVFCIMCAVLAIVIVMSGFVINKVGGVVQLLMHPNLPTTATPTDTSASDVVDEPTGSETVFHDPDHVHDFVKFKTHYASCTEGGYVIYRCSCGETEIRDMTDAYGHKYDGGTKFFSCTEGSYTKYVCSRCKHENKRDVVGPSGHKFTIKEDHAATCTENAYIVRKCSNPGCTASETEITPNSAKGHSFGQWEDTGNGKKLSCTNCDCVIMANQLKITKQYTSDSRDRHTLYIGTGDGATDIYHLYTCDIVDNRSEDARKQEPLSYEIDRERLCLVIQCGTNTYDMVFKLGGNTYTIENSDSSTENSTEGPTEGPTESSTENA